MKMPTNKKSPIKHLNPDDECISNFGRILESQEVNSKLDLLLTEPKL